MSKCYPLPIQCPHCEHGQEVTVWESINVTLDPELKEDLFAGKINFVECEECGETSFINFPLLYHDMNSKFTVQYYPEEAIGEDSFLEQFNSDGSIIIEGIPEQFAGMGKHLEHPHIVFDMNEMLRYVRFRDALAAAEL